MYFVFTNPTRIIGWSHGTSRVHIANTSSEFNILSNASCKNLNGTTAGGSFCIRATRSSVARMQTLHECVLFDAPLAHRGSAYNSSEPALRFAFTFIQTSASKRQQLLRKWVQDCTGIKKPLNLSVAQFFCDDAAAAAGTAVPPASHGPAAGSGQPTEPPLPVQCPSPVTHCGAVAPCRARLRGSGHGSCRGHRRGGRLGGPTPFTWTRPGRGPGSGQPTEPPLRLPVHCSSPVTHCCRPVQGPRPL